MAEVHSRFTNSVSLFHDNLEELERKIDILNPQPKDVDNKPLAIPERRQGVVHSFMETAEAFECLNKRLNVVNKRLAELF